MALEPIKTATTEAPKVPGTPVRRPKRTPLSRRDRLSYGGAMDPDRVYRFINDKDERLSQAVEGGWSFENGKDKIGDPRAAEGGAIDSRVSKPVGGGIRGYLMSIPKDLYDEDQSAKIAAIEKTEAAMKPNKAEGQYGDGLTNT